MGSGRPLSPASPAPRSMPLHRRSERDYAAGGFEVTLQGQHQRVTVDDAGFRRQNGAAACEVGLEGARLRRLTERQAFDIIGEALLVDAFDLGLFESRRLRRSACRIADEERRGSRRTHRASADRRRSGGRGGNPAGNTCRHGSPRCCATTRRYRSRRSLRTTTTEWPRMASARAIARPTTPAPMTRTSIRHAGRVGGRAR